MTMFTKGDKTVSNYKLEREDGTIVLNAPDEMWIEEGWEKVILREEEEELQKRGSTEEADLEGQIQSIIQESEYYYNSVILKAEFDNSLVWLPLEERVSYEILWKDLKEVGEKEVEFMGKTVDIDKAIGFIKTMNVFEYQTGKVLKQHLDTLRSFKSIEGLMDYDYTKGYPDLLVLESSDKK